MFTTAALRNLLALQSLLRGDSCFISKPSILAQTLGILPLPLFSTDWLVLPGSAHCEQRPHVREGLAPPSRAVNVHHWLRFAETRMSTGMRGARERALCSGRRACALAAFQWEGGRGRGAGGRSGIHPAGFTEPWRQPGVFQESAGQPGGE